MPGFTASVLPVVETSVSHLKQMPIEEPVIHKEPEQALPIIEIRPAQQQTIFSEELPLPLQKAPEPINSQPPIIQKEVVTANENYHLRKPVQVQASSFEEKPIDSPEYFHLNFDVMEETPTLIQQQHRQKELHEMIGEKKDSLNDKLKQEKIELAHVLKDSPIKDLKKGIGVNDKFLFISELFRGDEGMYERSIKTINAFNILPEAEYWINRELKVKLGWNDNKETVQHFYQLVRRRFS
jgi:hypothetical protein